MLTKAKRIIKIGVLLGLLLFACTQILNVRSPITIEQALATSKARVYGYTFRSNGTTILTGVKLTLTKPNGTTTTKYCNAYSGYFAFSGDPISLPNGTYTLKAEKSGWVTVSKTFSMSEGYGASAKVKMVQSGSSSIGITPFMPWY